MAEKKSKRKHLNYVVLDDNLYQFLKDIKGVIKVECGDSVAHSELISRLRECVDETKFFSWLTRLKAAHSNGSSEISVTSKVKISKLLKGGHN
jgi:hypothetical protein